MGNCQIQVAVIAVGIWSAEELPVVGDTTLKSIDSVVLGLCTLAGGVWAILHFCEWVKQLYNQRLMPELAAEEHWGRVRLTLSRFVPKISCFPSLVLS